MDVRRAGRRLGASMAPGFMANRARRYERTLRARQGITAVTHRALADGPLIVEEGPFKGLVYPRDRMDDVDLLVAKLWGVYEQEITNVFRDRPRAFVDVGCADGYYAAGIAVAHPGLTVSAFDVASSARELCRTVAAANGVHVDVGGRFSHEGLAFDGALVLCDIEGAEAALFDARLVPRLVGATVVVEVHEDRQKGLSARLRGAFAATHTYQLVRPRPRTLEGWPLPPREAAMVLNERRPRDQHWLIFKPF